MNTPSRTLLTPWHVALGALLAALAPSCAAPESESAPPEETGSAALALTSAGLDFGGVYGTVDGSTPVPNPVTGASTCPAGYTAQQVLGTSGLNLPLTFCWRAHTTGQDPALDFGGLYGTVNGAAMPNPLTQASACPTNYGDLRVLGTSGEDNDLHLCFRDHAPGKDATYSFGGVWGSVNGAVAPNPATGAGSCPAGFFDQQASGTPGRDAPLHFCYETQGPFDFGGMYGTVAGSPVVNPATGASSCPSGYVSQQLLGTSGVDYPLFLCWAPHAAGSDPALDFGGMWGTSGSGTLVNPYTQAGSCPAGYTDEQVLGTFNVDYSLHACYRTHQPGTSTGYLFGGASGFANGTAPNPATGTPSCPSGYVAQTVLGTVNVDYPVVFCYQPQLPLDFGGAFGTVNAQPVVNPVTGASSCPSGYVNEQVLGWANVDYPFDVCSRPHQPGFDPPLDFGGMWGVSNGATVLNAYTQAASCPGGYTDQHVMGTSGVDNDLHLCYRAHQAGAVANTFGGVWGAANGATSRNPATGAGSCPSGFVNQVVFGTTNVDYPVHVCYQPSLPLDFGGAFGTVNAQPVVNPATGASSCPAGYLNQPVLGTFNKDYPFNVCSRPHVAGVDPQLDFGGMWGVSNGSLTLNPYTQTSACPAGYTDQHVLGTFNVDNDLHVCWRAHSAGTFGYVFGGVWGAVGGATTPNPATGAATCPSGYVNQTVFGTFNVDYPVNLCFPADGDLDSAAFAVAQKIAPNIYLHSQDDYRPSSVDWYLPLVQLDYGSDKILPVGSVSPLSVVASFPDVSYDQGAGDWSLAAGNGPIHDCTLFNQCTATQEMISVYAGQPIVSGESASDAYVHVMATGANTYRLHYWFFYPYNGGLGFWADWHSTPLASGSGVGQHEGDWESITAQVTLSGSLVTVNSVTFNQHGDAMSVPVTGNQGVTVDQLTPIVAYSAWHSHASYPTAGTQTRISGFANDYTDAGPLWRTGQHLVQVQAHEPAWIDYPGKWGTQKHVETAISGWTGAPSVRTDGPAGPAFHGSDW